MTIKTGLRFHAAVTTILMLLVLQPSNSRAQQPAGIRLVDVSNVLNPFEREGLGAISVGLGGVAWLDYNNDGKLDLFIANGAGHRNALFRNNGDGTFTDVAIQAGVANGLGNSRVVAVDIDNDGCVDLFLVGEGAIMGVSQTPNNLYINNCDGTFTDITAQSGIDTLPSGAMAAFGDINNDGFVDLFITGPGNVRFGVPQKNRLFLNNGNRTFTDISRSAGIDSALGACAVGFSDFNHDGLADIFVATCNGFSAPFQLIPTPFQLFRNNGDLTFTDVAPQAGLAELGFWMSVTLGDYDRNGNIATSSLPMSATFRQRSSERPTPCFGITEMEPIAMSPIKLVWPTGSLAGAPTLPTLIMTAAKTCSSSAACQFSRSASSVREWLAPGAYSGTTGTALLRT